MRFLLFLLVIYLPIPAPAENWTIHNNSTNGVALFRDGPTFGGTVARSTNFHFVGDNQIGGRVRKVDAISARGKMRFSVGKNFNASFQLGHFESKGEGYVDFVGIKFHENSIGTLRAQPVVVLNNGAVRGGGLMVIPAGEYEWAYAWNPTGGSNSAGALEISLAGPVAIRSSVHFSMSESNTFFAGNSFGFWCGKAPNADTNQASVEIWDATYTTNLPPIFASHTRVFLLIGQSNARGKDPRQRPELREPNPAVSVFTDQWTVGRAPTEPRSYYGCELSLGARLAEILGEPVAIIKVTLGGRGVEEEWLPELGLSYTRLIDATKRALASRERPIISGLFSVQGEDDSKSQAWASRYAENLAKIHAQAQTDLGARFPIFVSRVPSFIGAEYGSAVRAAQESFDWINTDDLGHMGDSLHFDGAALQEIGRRFAELFRVSSSPFFFLAGNSIGLAAIPGVHTVFVSSDLKAWERREINCLSAYTPLPASEITFYRRP